MHRANHALLLLVIIGTTSFLTDGALQPHQHHHGDGCFPEERAALLSFRKGITSDAANVLASWRGQDCCRWRGIKCSNRSGHVVKLRLRNPVPDFRDDPCQDDNALFGEISPSLFSLKHLEHMDLSMNCLPGQNSQFPHLLGSMGNLRYLNLSGIPFTGKVPPQLGNLSKLQYLGIARLFGAGGVSDMYSPDVTWLANLPKLKYLGMSGINLSGRADWPHTLNMLPSLRVLHLASCSLDTANQSLPYFNLTKLDTLDLGFNNLDHTIASGWFWKATSIKYLDLTYNKLLGQLPDAIGNMTSLHVLYLGWNFNKDIVIKGNLQNLCSLEILDISGNNMNGDIAVLVEALPQCAWKQLQELNFGYNNFTRTLPDLLEKFTNLDTLDLNGNNLTGSIPRGISALTNLHYLGLSSNNFCGSIPSEIGALTDLAYLELRYNNFSGSVPSEIGALTNLAYINLSSNNFSGSLPSEIGSLTNLASLDLGYNKFSGSVPSEISALTNLTYLILRNNNFSGLITEKNLQSLQSLKGIDLSSNNLKIVVDPDWNHPFNLDYAAFAHCQMGPKFPAWLERQPEIFQLNLSNTGLKDKIPDWFWSTFSYVEYLDISYNQISGSLPAHLRDMPFELLNLRSNQFTGPLPHLPRYLTILDISSNAFSGTLPSYFKVSEQFFSLLMSSNKFGGRIPESLCKLVNLEYLDFSNNFLEGKIPQCFEVKSMKHLLLSNNSLSGTFPAVLKKCTDLEFLDLSWNKFHGRLPSWIGELGGLHILRLGHNVFSGTIPVSIANLSNLQYLDLSSNNISGVIPRHLSNLTSMTLKGFTPIELCTSLWFPVDYSGNDDNFVNCGQFGDILSIITKGQRLSYGGTLAYFVGIDLSENLLTGGIPADIAFLDAAISLNLSSNHLSGKIPKEIGALHSLESLDLSMNKISGEIPSSLSSLTSLSYLNLSYNNLSGRIPSSRQLDTLDVDNPALMYIGNSGLCGPPLQKNCSGNDTGTSHVGSNNHEEFELMTFYFGLVLGLVAGLWSVFCALLFKKAWRTAYFLLFDEMYDRIYVYVVVKWASLVKKTDENEQVA